MNVGVLYAVGIGPGDPELLTLKAARLIREARVLCVPKGRDAGESLALSIARGAVDLSGKEIMEVYFPMTRGSQRENLKPAAEQIAGMLRAGEDVVFITLGDPTLFSTFFHLMDAMHAVMPEAKSVIVPGISSIMASAARAGISLALSGQKVAVLPTVYMDSIERTLLEFDTVVLMKVHRVLGELKDALSRIGLLDGAIFASNVGMPDEIVRPLAEIDPEKHKNYFSTVIVRRGDG